MANSVYRLDITTADTGMTQKLQGNAGSKWEIARSISNYFKGLACGSNTASLGFGTSATAAAASGTLTLSSCIATDAFKVGSKSIAIVASGATADQVNVGASDDATRDAIIAKMNAHAVVSKYVTASIGGVAASGTLTCVGAVAGNAPHCGATTFTAVAPGVSPSTVQWNIPLSHGVAVLAKTGATQVKATFTLATFNNIFSESAWQAAIGMQMDAYLDGTTVWTLDNTNAPLVITNVDTVNRVVTFSANATDATALDGDTCYFYKYLDYDSKCAANLAAAINANATQNALVSATSALGVVTITALNKGTLGNAFTLTAGTNVARSGATLANGTSVVKFTANELSYLGNEIELTATPNAGSTIVASGSGYLTGGLSISPTTYSFGQ